MRESKVERQDALQVRDMLWRERNVECLQVLVEVLDLATTKDREYVGTLLHDVRRGDYIMR